MKKPTPFILSIALFTSFFSNAIAQTSKPTCHKKVTIAQYLEHSLNRILKLENLNECLSRTIDIRFLTSDCNAFLDELDQETQKVHSAAQSAYLKLKNESSRAKATLYLDLYTDMMITINTLKSKKQNDIDKQNLAFLIRHQVLETRKKMSLLKDFKI